MDKSLEIKLKGMLWDIPDNSREKLFRQILKNPHKAFLDDQLLVRALNSLSWYELITLLGPNDLVQLLSESAISKLYPRQRQRYYRNAKRLLSKYTLSSAG